MANDSIVKWQNSYSVGVKLIDDQHMKLIELTNKLFNSCVSGCEREESGGIFLKVFHEIIDYVIYHFNTEERVMERIGYLGYKLHKQEHSAFAGKVLNKAEEFNLGKVKNPLSFVYYLRDWVLQHIAVTDKKLGVYILDMKRRGDLQQIVLRAKRDYETNRVHVG